MNLARTRLDPAIWVVLAGVSAALHVGKLSPAVPVLREALGVTLLQAGFLLANVQLAGMALGLFIGLLADGLGLRRSLVSGLFILALASAAGSVARDATDLLWLRGIEGLGFLLVALPAPGLIRRLVTTTRLSTTLGWWGTYMPVGTALALLLDPWLMGLASWQAWWLVLGGVSAAMACVVLRLVPADPVRSMPHEITTQATPTLLETLSFWKRRLLRTLRKPGPWWVALSFACYASQWLAVVGFLPTVVAQITQGGVFAQGLGAAGCMALVAGLNAVGNVAAGRLLARGWPPARLLMLGFLSMALGAWVAFAPWAPMSAAADVSVLTWLVRLAGVAGFSMLGGLIPGTLFSLAVRVAPDEGTVSTTVGWMQQFSAAGQFGGPPLVAWVAARQGGWELTWVVTGLASAVGLALAWCIARELRPQALQRV
jgi:MFS family permease